MDLRTAAASRRLWLAAVALAAAVVGLFVYSFVGTFVFGLFVYYAARPVHERVRRAVDSRGLAATLTMLALVLPVFALVSAAGVVAFREFAAVAGAAAVDTALSALPGDPQSISAVLRRPETYLARLDRAEGLRDRVLAVLSTLGTVGNAALHLTLSLSFAFFLLRDGVRVDRWFRDRVADADSAVYAFARAVDADLEDVYFGNVVTVVAVAGASVLVYNGYNLLAPAALRLPAPTLLALLTGLATFVPIVVGKLVYLPATAYLLRAAAVADAGAGASPVAGAGAGYLYPVGFLVVSFLFLDVLPQTVLRPYLSAGSLHGGLVLFAYVLGAALFGWYGLFLGPLLAVVVVQVVSHAFPHVVTGEPVDTEGAGLALGSDPTPTAGDGGDGGDDDGDDDGDDGDDDGESGEDGDTVASDGDDRDGDDTTDGGSFAR